MEDDNLFYNLTLVKKDQKNFSITEIKTTIAKQQLIVGIYAKSLALMLKLGISEQNIIYYANLAEFYTIQKLKRMANKNIVRLYLLCYVHRRLLKINDHLVTSFIHKLTHYGDKADDYQRAKIDISEAVDKQLRKQAWQVMAINIDERTPTAKLGRRPLRWFPKTVTRSSWTILKSPTLTVISFVGNTTANLH